MVKHQLFDEMVGLQVFSILEDFWKKKKGIFRNAVLPQNQWVIQSADRNIVANWFFYAALPMRGGIISEAPFKWFWKAQEKYPEMFDPESVFRNWSVEKISKVMIEIGKSMYTNGKTDSWNEEKFGFKMSEFVQHWFHNSIVIQNHWGGNILNVYDGVRDFEEAFSRIDHRKNSAGIKGMRRKIFALLTIWLQEKNLIPVFPTPIPVDFHALRIIFATNIIRHSEFFIPFQARERHAVQLNGLLGRGIYEKHVDTIAIWSQKFIYEKNLSHLSINPALWFLSRILCGRHYQNVSSLNGTSFITSSVLESNPDLWPKNYKNPCFFCPIEKFCHWSIPASPYYDWGLLVILGKRIPYSLGQPYLPGIDWQDFIDFKSAKKNGQ